jgi:hypothetical protein
LVQLCRDIIAIVKMAASPPGAAGGPGDMTPVMWLSLVTI